MAEIVITFGWLCDLACMLWLALISADLILSWIPSVQKKTGWLIVTLNQLTVPLVNMIRRTIPTMYRGIDFAPWITIIMLILIKTFACRAIIYWGMLHGS